MDTYNQLIGNSNMGNIKTIIDREIDLTTQKCIGNVKTEDVSEKIEEYYRDLPTKNILWDLREADLSEISTNDVREIAEQIGKFKPEGKSAILAEAALSLCLSNMFSAYSKIVRPEFPIPVFSNHGEALSNLLGWTTAEK